MTKEEYSTDKASETEKTIQVSFHLEKDFHIQLKVFLAQHKLSLRDFVTHSLKAGMRQRKPLLKKPVDLTSKEIDALKNIADMHIVVSDLMSVNHKLHALSHQLHLYRNCEFSRDVYSGLEFALSGICHLVNQFHQALPETHTDCGTCEMIAEGINPLEIFSEVFTSALGYEENNKQNIESEAQKETISQDGEITNSEPHRIETDDAQSINFRVSSEFRREFKREAINKDISMTELLYRAFGDYKRFKAR